MTLPPDELRLVLALQAKLKAKSIEVVRRGLRLLRDATGRQAGERPQGKTTAPPGQRAPARDR
jgi:hypothetical protein